MPSQPGTPQTPSTPEQPEVPSQPGTPQLPEQPAVPTARQANNAQPAVNNATELPQTGDDSQRGATLAGLGLIGMMGALFGFKKKRERKNESKTLNVLREQLEWVVLFFFIYVINQLSFTKCKSKLNNFTNNRIT